MTEAETQAIEGALEAARVGRAPKGGAESVGGANIDDARKRKNVLRGSRILGSPKAELPLFLQNVSADDLGVKFDAREKGTGKRAVQAVAFAWRRREPLLRKRFSVLADSSSKVTPAEVVRLVGTERLSHYQRSVVMR